MPQTHDGAMKILAKKAGVTTSQLITNQARGLKWCYRCKAWKKRKLFQSDLTRWDGRASVCKDCRKEMYRASYVPKGRTSKKGCRFVAARDGDKLQARARVNQLVKNGLLPDPDDLRCTDCGHIGKDLRHAYDHYLGYSIEHQEDVQPVCYPCHGSRTKSRGEFRTEQNIKAAMERGRKRRHGVCGFGHPITLMKDGKRRCRICRLAYYKNYNDNRRRKNV